MIPTSESAEPLSTEDEVRSYKNLTQVEGAFRSFKGLDLLGRPSWHDAEDHARAHAFLCVLAYYVEWQLQRPRISYCLMMKSSTRIVRNEIL